MYFCSEDCLIMYKEGFNNEKICVMSILICIIACLLICLVFVLFDSEPRQQQININLSV